MSVMGSALTLRNSPHFLRHIRPYLLLVSQYRSHVPPPLQAHEEAVGNKCRYCHRNSVCKRKKCSQLRPAAQISEPRYYPTYQVMAIACVQRLHVNVIRHLSVYWQVLFCGELLKYWQF
ncbi:uncharacterized protein [Physcomitrium patens]|uniref:uncharacterized protein isoform X3 n=1 Tax=Physcomitrium patens TaxID=3218 RepID=UPI003CCDAA06